MILQHIDIRGFRGISQLSLPLTPTNLLIGENAWGKSSLLDALTLLLSPQTEDYQFTPADFYFTPGDVNDQRRRLQIVFHFRDDHSDQDALLTPFWQRDAQGQRWLYYSTRAKLRDGHVSTTRRFVDQQGNVLPEEGTGAAIRHLLHRYPVLRLRDARFSRRRRDSESNNDTRTATLNQLAMELDTLTRDLVTQPQTLSDEVLRQGLQTMQQLMEHYFWCSIPKMPVKRAALIRKRVMACKDGARWIG